MLHREIYTSIPLIKCFIGRMVTLMTQLSLHSNMYYCLGWWRMYDKVVNYVIAANISSTVGRMVGLRDLRDINDMTEMIKL